MVITRPKLAVFASGTGTNLAALIQATQTGEVPAEIVRVVVDRRHTGAQQLAETAGIPVLRINYKDYATRELAEDAMLTVLAADGVVGILLAGYMRILTPKLVNAFHQRIINIHPALLPSFPGNSAIVDAWQAGVKVTGVTIHYVDDGVDSGEIIAQEAVKLTATDDLAQLTTKIHAVEHTLYPATVAMLIKKGVFVK